MVFMCSFDMPSLCIALRLQSLFSGDLLRSFVCDRFGVCCAFRCRISHHCLILHLGILLRYISLLHLLVQVSDEQIDHGHHSIAHFSFLAVSAKCFRWWWGRTLVSRKRRLLHKCTNASARNSTRRRCDDLTTQVNCDSLLCRQLPLWRWLVQLGIVALVETVFGKHQDLLRCTVIRHQLLVICILSLPQSCRLSDGVVKGFHIGLELSNFLNQLIKRTLHLSDSSLRIGNGILQHFLLV